MAVGTQAYFLKQKRQNLEFKYFMTPYSNWYDSSSSEHYHGHLMGE